jgi:hypothetical protein
LKSSRSFVAQRRIAACALILSVVACRSPKNDTPQRAAPKAPVVIAAPPGLAGELKIVGAKQLWPALQPLSTAASPLNAEILLVNLLGLPVFAADLLALDQPVRGVIISSGTKLPVVFG